ncbi:MerR-like helix-turn-helix DNA binding domain protein [Mycobacterium phage Daegal]|uniref:MerR-like helix-turn-helix DNA binding domain protein n=1 Tax=Mycobacterium phage Daegal TaxID=2517946 RepID=A0A482MDS8_9CAUD|nr:MerR-like helix-turn-helix DNA binding domain protein [Mycobacterium phage Daegal]
MSRHNARTADPATSHNAARANRASRQSHKRMMLAGFALFPVNGCTDAEAAESAGLMQPGVCWWHRASDLRDAGLIAWKTRADGTRVTVRGPNGVRVGVSVITDAGRDAVRGAA